MNGSAPALIRQPRAQSVLLANTLLLVQEGLVESCKSNPEYKVIGRVCDGAEAWRLIEEGLPDIAVLDLRLPVQSGLEIVQRAMQAKLSTKVIILAANSDREMLTVCLHSGARAFLLESASSEEFLGAFRQVAEGGIYISKELNLLESVSRHRSTFRDAMSGLPRRQFQVLSLLVEGLPTKAIAIRLKLSPATVAMHRAKLMRKLDIHTVAGLVKFVFDMQPDQYRNRRGGEVAGLLRAWQNLGVDADERGKKIELRHEQQTPLSIIRGPGLRRIVVYPSLGANAPQL
jgi:DNA-binding NarL/FixJ family response regulator